MKIVKRQLPLWNTDTLFCPIIINTCWNNLIKFWSPETFSAIFFSLSMILVCLFVFYSTLFDRRVQRNMWASRIKFKILRNLRLRLLQQWKTTKQNLYYYNMNLLRRGIFHIRAGARWSWVLSKERDHICTILKRIRLIL